MPTVLDIEELFNNVLRNGMSALAALETATFYPFETPSEEYVAKGLIDDLKKVILKAIDELNDIENDTLRDEAVTPLATGVLHLGSGLGVPLDQFTTILRLALRRPANDPNGGDGNGGHDPGGTPAA